MPIVSDAAPSRQRLSLEIGTPKMAKANLQRLEVDYRVGVGRCMELTRKGLGWSLQELANEIEQVHGDPRDLSQLARWEKGKERLQTDVLMALPSFGPKFLIALAKLRSDRIKVQTTITIDEGAV